MLAFRLSAQAEPESDPDRLVRPIRGIAFLVTRPGRAAPPPRRAWERAPIRGRPRARACCAAPTPDGTRTGRPRRGAVRGRRPSAVLLPGRPRSSTAMSSPTRPGSTPLTERRGTAVRPSTTSACSSTSNGRWPSSTGTTTEPATPGRRSARNTPEGSVTGASPVCSIENTPSSCVEPKRCFVARRSRSE